jgi:hypothetical protein
MVETLSLLSKFTRFHNFMANLGLVIRDDPPKVIDMTGRVWGEPVDGLVLSIRELPREEERQVAGISVVMKNEGAEAKTMRVPEGIFFYRVEGLELSPYGRQFMNSQQKDKRIEVNPGPGEATETDLPLATIYNLKSAGNYNVRVSCELPGGALLKSNEITIRV